MAIRVVYFSAVTSHSLLLNIPIAAALIVLAIWLATHFQIEPATTQKKKWRSQKENAQEGRHTTILPTPFAPLPEGVPGSSSKSGRNWREQVASPLVENAWETLCGSILQEVDSCPKCISTSSITIHLRASHAHHLDWESLNINTCETHDGSLRLC